MNSINNWNEFYKRLDEPVCDIDCGTLCAPSNNGVPVCCDHQINVPVLFTDELAWLRKHSGTMWKKRAARSPEEKKDDAELDGSVVYGRCCGVKGCIRSKRSLSCRFFPFEPYIDAKNSFAGLVFMNSVKTCPLITTPGIRINQKYIDQSVAIWKTLFQLYPDELELYTIESRKLRKQFARKNMRVRVFRPHKP